MLLSPFGVGGDLWEAAVFFKRMNERGLKAARHGADGRTTGVEPLLGSDSGDALPDVSASARPASLASLDRLGQTVVATITVTELTGRDTAELVAELLGHVEGSGVRHFVFDLQNVNYMDSSCIGVMVEMLTQLQKAGGRIALVNASQSVDCLFKLTKLDRIFPICPDVMVAIEAVERAG